jgi:hypothetical protein
MTPRTPQPLAGALLLGNETWGKFGDKLASLDRFRIHGASGVAGKRRILT